MDRTKSQNQFIAEYLKSGKSIDPLKAQEISGSMNLAQRIANLKRPPYNLDVESIQVNNNGNYYCRYKLKEVKEKSFNFWQRVSKNIAL